MLSQITLKFLKLSLFGFTAALLTGILISFVPKVSAASMEVQVESLINSERQKQNLPPYNHSVKLFQASLDHNIVMSNCAKTYGANSCFQHTVSLLGEKTLMERIKATGYNPQSVAENIAWGYTTATSVVNGWMNSSGHRANILGNYKDIGCDYIDSLNGSYKGVYWTCDFGRSFNVSSVPTPTIAPTAQPTTPLTPTPTRALSTPTPTPLSNIAPIPTSKPWWCVYVPTHYLCK